MSAKATRGGRGSLDPTSMEALRNRFGDASWAARSHAVEPRSERALYVLIIGFLVLVFGGIVAGIVIAARKSPGWRAEDHRRFVTACGSASFDARQCRFLESLRSEARDGADAASDTAAASSAIATSTALAAMSRSR